MIDWHKPIETVPDERNPAPVQCSYSNGHVFINGAWIDDDGEDEGGGYPWIVNLRSGTFATLAGAVRNVAEHPMPEPTATWWARRWYDSASPDEREAMRVILAGEG